jgi:hypothetical protein
VAAVFDSVGPSASGVGQTGSPTTWTHTTVAASTIVIVAACLDGVAPGVTASATLGGVTMTQLGPDVPSGSGGTTGILRAWSASAVASGAHTIVVTCATQNNCSGGSIAFSSAAALGTPATSAVSANGTTSAITVAASAAGSLICAFIGSGNSITATSGPATSRFVNNFAGAGGQSGGDAAGATSTGGGSVTVTWSDTSSVSATFAVEVQSAGGGQTERMPQQLSRITKHRRGASQRPQFNAQLPSVNIIAPQVTASAAVLLPAVTVGAPYIAGLGGVPGTGYFQDQAASPRFVLGDAAWAWCGNAGRWNSGNWQADFDTYLANRAGQGYTVIYTKPVGSTQSLNLDDNGKTFDSLYPFQGGTPSTGVAGANPSTGLTASFWARIDYMLSSALAKGITIFLNAIGYNTDFNGGGTGGFLIGKSDTEFQAYGTALGGRYKNQPNLIWLLADDYFGTKDSAITAFMTGVSGAGDTHLVAIENFPETTGRKDVSNNTVLTWGTANAKFSWCYSYNATYFAVEYAYTEASPIPVIQGDGYFGQGGSTYSATLDRAMRQDAWHAVTSGARGVIQGYESIWQYQSTALASSGTDWYPASNAGNIRALVESLPNWHLLVPDTSSALVTAGRGTRATTFSSGGGGGQLEPAFTDTYVTASRTPAGDLSLIYMSHATTITIDQTKMVAGYLAYWADPVTGVKTLTTSGTTYNSTAKGNNSKGDPDWVLVLQAPAGGAAAVPVIAPGAATTQAANW